MHIDLLSGKSASYCTFLFMHVLRVLAIKTLPGQVLSIREEKQAIEWSIPEIMGQTHATAHFKVTLTSSSFF